MSKDLSPEQMHAIASHMSALGRNGDSQLIHVMPEEVELLEKIGGSGTVNPHTGLKEFFFGEYTSIGDMFDGGGPGQSGDTYDNDNDPNNEVKGIARASNYAIGRGDANDGKDDNDKPGNSGFIKNVTGYDSIKDMFDGGGKGMSGDTYGHGDFSKLDKDGDGHISKQESGKGLPGGIDGDNDSVFNTALNVVGLVANPIGYLAGKAVKSVFSGSGSGNSRPTPVKTTTRRGGSSQSSSTTSSTETSTETSTPTDVTEATPELSGDFGYSTVSNFSTRLNGSSLIEYDYSDGTGKPVGTYNGNEKPFHIATSMENARAYAMSQEGSNLIEQLVSELPRDIMDKLQGNVSLFSTSDDKIALVAGDGNSGFIEATYDATEEGYGKAMGDINKMFDYARVENDTSIDAGFMGRVASYQQYKGYGTPGLQIELNKLFLEIQNYEPGTPQYNQARRAIQAIQRELARRTKSGEEVAVKYSVDGVTENITQTVDGMLSA